MFSTQKTFRSLFFLSKGKRFFSQLFFLPFLNNLISLMIMNYFFHIKSTLEKSTKLSIKFRPQNFVLLSYFRKISFISLTFFQSCVRIASEYSTIFPSQNGRRCATEKKLEYTNTEMFFLSSHHQYCFSLSISLVSFSWELKMRTCVGGRSLYTRFIYCRYGVQLFVCVVFRSQDYEWKQIFFLLRGK